ncbi:MAG: class I SAM-dependent methyltransferase [Actinomycetota bacterium]
MSEHPTQDDVRSAWEANAAVWNRRMAESDSWQQTLVFPVVERLAGVSPGETILEIACGNGLLAQRLAERGASVVATDFSPSQLGFARERVTAPAVEILELDASDEAELLALGEERFDAAVASMALMDMIDIEPLARALPRLLAPGGRFVLCVTHPSFNSVSSVPTIERKPAGTSFIDEHSVRVSTYIRESASQGVGIVGQPEPQWYFDRPLSALLRPFLGAGLVLDALDEPVFDEETAARFDERELWTEIPPVLAARLRRTA